MKNCILCQEANTTHRYLKFKQYPLLAIFDILLHKSIGPAQTIDAATS